MSETLPAGVLADFQRAGTVLHTCRCNNSHSGNLSVRQHDRIIVTRTGAMLSDLGAGDLVTTSPKPTEHEREIASSELVVHLKIYEHTDHHAIAHGHALAAVAVGWMTDRLTPIDVEGALYFGRIPVVAHCPATADADLGHALADVLRSAPVVILRGHGVFAGGESIEQAAQRITSVNDSARLIIKATQLGLDINQIAKSDFLIDAAKRHSQDP